MNATAAAAAQYADGIVGDVDDPKSLLWLWRTVGATCCWALSDVICDACIRPACPAAQEEVGTSAPLEALEPASRTSPAGLRKRPRPQALRDSHPSKGASAQKSRRAALLVSPRLRPCAALLPEVPALLPMKPTMNPHKEEESEGEDNSFSHQLSPEQNAFVSGLVSLLTVVIFNGVFADGATETPNSLFRLDMPCAMAALGGVFHFTAYLVTLCAFSSASSTVITPLMQLSAVWMLPFSSLAALLGFASFIRPAHLLSVLLIFVGGFLPAARGSLSSLATAEFWGQRAVRYVVLGELLICCYNVILHQSTFGTRAMDGTGDALHFFLLSRVANGMTCMFMFWAVPSLRSHVVGLHKVDLRCFGVALLGECLSMLGVCLVTFSYASFYEPSVVNAVEGGLQQLFNLVFAVALHRFLGLGRGVEQMPVKCVSLLLVAAGLTLSTV
eukprot:TRINITY_DN41573_c0_g1_i1.p1 TRINITY_DN41573_c0_g1~~TRINITY_DN41573_c0_g1_i1.p1  ORF type:complete len:444 (+),score=63.14 TRINITY_DN41573_c0_g1_i1:25-1356(+)